MASYTTVAANDQGRAFVAWEDTRNDSTYFNDDIYFATGAMAAIAEARPSAALRGTVSTYPNPVRTALQVKYLGRAGERFRVEIYDPSGRLVRRLEGGLCTESGGIVEWNGHDGRGRTVSPGVYLVRVQTQSGSETKQIQFLGN